MPELWAKTNNATIHDMEYIATYQSIEVAWIAARLLSMANNIEEVHVNCNGLTQVFEDGNIVKRFNRVY